MYLAAAAMLLLWSSTLPAAADPIVVMTQQGAVKGVIGASNRSCEHFSAAEHFAFPG